MNEKTADLQTVLPLISNLPLFSGLDEKEFNIAAGIIEILHFKKGETIVREGDPGEDMFIHFSGTLNAFVTQSDGNRRSMFNIDKGDFFGEMSIITHEPRYVTITAEEDAITVKLSGNDFFRIIHDYPAIGFKILKAIGIVQNKRLEQTSKTYTDLIRWGETARKRSITDEMTGLYNRRFLEETIRDRFNNQSLNLRVMSLLMIDLDEIHGINDRYGQKAGDIVIITAAAVIRSCLRSGDIIARFSGDEFAVLLPDTNIDNAVKAAERIRKKIESKKIEVPASPDSAETVFIATKTSIGAAVAPEHANSLEELYDASDEALRKAKESGRNKVEVYVKRNEN